MPVSVRVKGHLTAGGEMTPAQYHCIARLLRLPEPSAVAARLVLIDGVRQVDAAAAGGVSPSSLSRTVIRVRAEHARILDAFATNRAQVASPSAPAFPSPPT